MYANSYFDRRVPALTNVYTITAVFISKLQALMKPSAKSAYYLLVIRKSIIVSDINYAIT